MQKLDGNLDQFIGSDDEDMQPSRRDDILSAVPVDYYLHKPPAWAFPLTKNGEPPSLGGLPGGTEAGTGWQSEAWGPIPGTPSTAYFPAAGNQSQRVKAPNLAHLSYPWHLPLLAHAATPDSSVPVEFDWRTQPGAPRLTPVQDQGTCGCCWAWASSQSLADRMRIANSKGAAGVANAAKSAATGGAPSVPVLSAEYVKDCGTAALGERYEQLLGGQQTGLCSTGGVVAMGCEFLANYGAVSSGVLPYSPKTFAGEDANECLKPTSSDTLYTAKKGSVAVITVGPNGHAPASHSEVATPGNLDAATIASNCLNMQKNIMAYGPLCVTFLCYKDLCTADFSSSEYKDGVYTADVSSGVDGGHAVTIVGWGVGKDQQTPYWIVRNSWGSNWNSSMGGYYLHKRGTNDSQIETSAVSLQAGSSKPGAGKPVSGSKVLSQMRRLQQDSEDATSPLSGWLAFWRGLSTPEQVGLVSGGVLLVGLLVALVAYLAQR